MKGRWRPANSEHAMREQVEGGGRSLMSASFGIVGIWVRESKPGQNFEDEQFVERMARYRTNRALSQDEFEMLCRPSTRSCPCAYFAILPFALHTQSTQNPTKISPLAGPAVRLLLAHYNLKTDGLKPSGPKKNILKSDVLSYISAKKLCPAIMDTPSSKMNLNNEVVKTSSHPTISHKLSGHAYLDLPLSSMRLTIAKRLSQSKKSIPHAYASAFITADQIMDLRRRLSERTELKLSMNDFIIKACALALRSVPELNVQWCDGSIRRIPSVDISIAVATPNGLITPILFNVDQLALDQISGRLRELAGRARDGRLRPEEFQGGTFTISNLGMFGSVSNFTAIINPPQAAILAIGGMEKHFEPDGTKRPKLVSEFGVTLCYDARAIEWQTAKRFLDIVKNALTSPESLLVGIEHLFEDEEANLEEMDKHPFEANTKIGKDDEELVKLLLR
uniref:Dolichyl-diphosphooligosaccharide--protein glycosyltransferase subunit 1 n=1 Tax=Globodera rostochiensis TaxID=31243 RepID=A0A914I8E0_GLORO